ncbi:MAG: helix-turn-helix domain-containing protein [Bacteroidota bacterium]
MQKRIVFLSDCPIHRSMAILGTKWKPVIIWALRERKMRFGQIAVAIGTISRKVLTTTLNQLEQDGIVYRKTSPETTSPHVEYTLTEKGRDLIPLMLNLVEWDRKYIYSQN